MSDLEAVRRYLATDPIALALLDDALTESRQEVLEQIRQVHARHDLGHALGAWKNVCALCEVDTTLRHQLVAS